MSKSICHLYRAVVALVLLLLGAAAAAVAGILFTTRAGRGVWSGPGTQSTAWLQRADTWLAMQPLLHGTAIAAAALGIALLAWLLLAFVVRSMVQRTPRLVLSRGGLGEVAIDMRQVGMLAQHEAELVSGVREVDTAAESGKAGIDVQQTIAIEPEIAFAPLAEQVQQRVKRSLEFHLGFPVARVQVLLRHTAMRKGPI